MQFSCRSSARQPCIRSSQVHSLGRNCILILYLFSCFLQVDDRLNGDGAGLVLGVNDPILSIPLILVAGSVWAAYYFGCAEECGLSTQALTSEDDFSRCCVASRRKRELFALVCVDNDFICPHLKWLLSLCHRSKNDGIAAGGRDDDSGLSL